jgi:hypothetical protein
MAQIPRVQSRLTTFKVKFEAQLLLVEASTALHHHLHAQAELKASTCFAAVLEEALAHGVNLPLPTSYLPRQWAVDSLPGNLRSAILQSHSGFPPGR